MPTLLYKENSPMHKVKILGPFIKWRDSQSDIIRMITSLELE
jgi:hypothetical protein